MRLRWFGWPIHTVICGLSLLVGCSEGAENGFRQGKEREASFKEFRWKDKKELDS